MAGLFGPPGTSERLGGYGMALMAAGMAPPGAQRGQLLMQGYNTANQSARQTREDEMRRQMMMQHQQDRGQRQSMLGQLPYLFEGKPWQNPDYDPNINKLKGSMAPDWAGQAPSTGPTMFQPEKQTIPQPGLLGDVPPENRQMMASGYMAGIPGMEAVGAKGMMEAMAAPEAAPDYSRFKVVAGQLVDMSTPGGPTPVSGIGGAPDEKYGPMQFDEKLGQYYQTAPDGKRHYRSNPTGMSITTPEGLTIQTGVPTGGAGGLEKKTKAGIEDKLLAANENLARLHAVQDQWRPEFNEYETRLKVWGAGVGEKFGMEMPPELVQLQTEFKTWQRDGIENINSYIKEITGAQMSEKEADRIRLAQPDPGETVFSGDAPSAYRAKMNASIASLEKARVRYKYYLEKGITDIGTIERAAPLDDMQIIENPTTGVKMMSVAGEWVTL